MPHLGARGWAGVAAGVGGAVKWAVQPAHQQERQVRQAVPAAARFVKGRMPVFGDFVDEVVKVHGPAAQEQAVRLFRQAKSGSKAALRRVMEFVDNRLHAAKFVTGDLGRESARRHGVRRRVSFPWKRKTVTRRMFGRQYRKKKKRSTAWRTSIPRASTSGTRWRRSIVPTRRRFIGPTVPWKTAGGFWGSRPRVLFRRRMTGRDLFLRRNRFAPWKRS